MPQLDEPPYARVLWRRQGLRNLGDKEMSTKLIAVCVFVFALGLSTVAFATGSSRCEDSCDAEYYTCIQGGTPQATCQFYLSYCLTHCGCAPYQC